MPIRHNRPLSTGVGMTPPPVIFFEHGELVWWWFWRLWRATPWQQAQTSLTGLIGQKITVTATVADDPATSATRQVDYAITNIVLSSGQPLLEPVASPSA